MIIDQTRHETYQDKASELIGRFLCALVLGRGWQDEVASFCSARNIRVSSSLNDNIMAWDRAQQAAFIKEHLDAATDPEERKDLSGPVVSPGAEGHDADHC